MDEFSFATERAVFHVKTEGGGFDSMGDPIEGVPEDVEADVLVGTPGGDDLGFETLPNGVTVSTVLYLPKSFDHDLRGATVTLRSLEYRVVGEPIGFTEENVPGQFNIVCPIERTG